MPDFSKDLRKVDELIRAKELENVVGRLNPEQLSKSLEKVPIEVVRLIIVVAASGSIESVQKELIGMPAEKRRPLQAILTSLRKLQNPDDLLSKLLSEVRSKPELLKTLDVDAAVIAPKKDHALEMENIIDGLAVSPQIMLKSRGLYCDIGFMQGDRVLFRSKFEVDDLLWLSRSMLSAADDVLSLYEKNAKSVKIDFNQQKCLREIERVSELLVSVRKSVQRLKSKAK